MARILIYLFLAGLVLDAKAQKPKDQTTSERAREMYRVIGVDDKEQWEKFVRENYSKELLERTIRSKVSTSTEDGQGKSEEKTAKSIEEKAMLFRRLHNDFGQSKIVSLKPKDQDLEMILQNAEGLTGTFTLKFAAESPYLIDQIGIEVNN
jgi:hypothetical protein